MVAGDVHAHVLGGGNVADADGDEAACLLVFGGFEEEQGPLPFAAGELGPDGFELQEAQRGGLVVLRGVPVVEHGVAGFAGFFF